MSSNRLIYDDCAYRQNLRQSQGPNAYLLDVVKYENCQKCRVDLGVVSGAAVSHINGNLVDLESELRGQNRNASSCPTKHYIPSVLANNNQYQQPSNIKIANEPNRQGRVIETQQVHLPSCQLVRYPEVPLPTPIRYDNCLP